MAATKKSKQRKQKKMSIQEMTPQPHEIPGSVAQELLGFNNLASVRKLLSLSEIEGRKIGSDLWYDRNSVESYIERRRPRGRRPIEDEGGKRRGDELRRYNRLAQRVHREGGSLRDVEDKPRPWRTSKKKAKAKKGAAKKGAAKKGGSASKAGRSSKKRARSAAKKKK